MILTKKAIDKVARPAHGQVFIRDSTLQGFALRVSPTAKSFVLEKDIHGRTRRIAIGSYPAMSVDQARKEAHAMIVLIQKGGDPREARRQQRQPLSTWAELEQLYIARHLPRKKSAIDDLGLLNHHLAPWRPRALASITREDVARLHSKMGTRPSRVVRPGRAVSVPIPRTANKMLSLVRSMFNLASDWGVYTGTNPCTRIKRFPEVSRDRFVTPDEIPRLLTALAADPNQFVRVAFLVSLLVGARRDEVLTMQWSDVDFVQGTWRIPETKAGRVHLLPLPRPILTQLSTLPRFKDNSYVFCGRWGRGHLVNVSKPWKRIREAAGLDDVRIHDLRRTLGSWLVAQGHSLPLIGKALNHSSVGTTQVYARLQLDPVRKALEDNAEKMLTVIETDGH